VLGGADGPDEGRPGRGIVVAAKPGLALSWRTFSTNSHKQVQPRQIHEIAAEGNSGVPVCWHERHTDQPSVVAPHIPLQTETTGISGDRQRHSGPLRQDLIQLRSTPKLALLRCVPPLTALANHGSAREVPLLQRPLQQEQRWLLSTLSDATFSTGYLRVGRNGSSTVAGTAIPETKGNSPMSHKLSDLSRYGYLYRMYATSSYQNSTTQRPRSSCSHRQCQQTAHHTQTRWRVHGEHPIYSLGQIYRYRFRLHTCHPCQVNRSHTRTDRHH
jgi:hypothetical protein